MATYPSPTSLSGNNITVDWLMNNPKFIDRTLRTIAQQRLIGDKLLAGRVDLTGSGVAVFGVAESIMATRSPEIVAPLSAYPLSDDSPGTPSKVETAKNGLGTEVPDELVKRNRMDVVARKLTKLANRIVFDFDASVLSAIGSAVTQTQAASAAWNAAGADPLLDTLLSGATVDGLNQGYEIDTIVAKPVQWARLVAATKILDRVPREGGSNVVLTGKLVQFAGLNIFKSTNLPAGVDVMVLDSTALGSIAYEDLGGEFTGDPGDLQTHTGRIPGRDGFLIRARKVAVPMIQEPGAAVKVTGV